MAESRKQVSLRGSSAKEITRIALLEKVSQDREVRNFARRSATAAHLIQRVWRGYNVRKKVAGKFQEEWEAMVNHLDVPITSTWVSTCLLRPFIFFITPLRIADENHRTRNIKCMLTCFRILLESINSTDSQVNFCSLAIGKPVERNAWLHQTQKLISLCLFMLSECSRNDQDAVCVTSLGIRLVVVLTDSKVWKCVTKKNLKDAKVAVTSLAKALTNGKHGLYRSIREYISKLDYDISLRGDNFLIIASAVNLALRPFQVELHANDSASGDLDREDAIEKYCVFLLTIPLLVQRLPAVLVPALKHDSVLSACFRTLLISNKTILMKMTKLDQSKEPDCSNNWVSPVGWLLANIINLATPNKNDSLGTGWFAQGINVALYVRVAVVVAENLLPMLESVKHTKKNCGYLGNAEMFIEATDPDILESEVNGVSLKISYLDLFRPVHQQWHLSTLLATIKTDVLVPILGDLGKFELLDVAYYYSYMLRILSSLNPGNGPSPILNMLSYTPGFLFSLFGVLESIIGYPTNDNKPCRSGTSKGEYDKSFEKKQRKTLRDSGIKWANLLQKITGKLPTNINITDTTDSEHRLYGSNNVEEDSSKLWDIELFKRGPQGVSKDVACLLHLFCEAYTHLLLILDDIEFYEKQVPFSLEQQRRITSVLNTLVYNGVSHNNNNNGPQHKPLMDASVKCLHLLYERDCRRQFCPPSLWLSPARKCRPPIAAAARAHEAIFASSTKAGDLVTILSMSSIVTITPHIFPFNERVQMFREFIKLEKVSRRMAGEGVGLGPGSIEIVVRRGHIVEDGFKQLNNLGSRLKSKIHVSFVSESGLPEAGLDYGGLSKEFLTDISKAAFDPNYGLFSQTSTSERLLMPNTSARLLDNGMQMIEFLGRVVGKGLYEGILLDYSFSRVFIQKLLGRYSFLDELSTLDPELYRNLMYLKHYDGDVQDLTLDFTVTEELLGKRVVTELKPGGKDVSVTNENKLHYLHAVADYKLNKQVLPLANAFYRGLSDIILPSWLSLFNPNEFNQLLSGGNHDMDVDDLRSNTRYTGGYSAESRTIKIFWEVIIGFEPEERCMLLKFVTSCSRAPLLGFKHLQPTFTIHKVTCDAPLWATIGGQDVDRLPSASTCYNTLKLPTYKRSSTLRSKLLYAISSNAGFELS